MANIRAFLRWGVPLLGVILLIVGWVVTSQPVTFGWFAYAPLPEAPLLRLPEGLITLQGGGAVALISGITLIAGSVGFWLGHRARPNNVLEEP